MSRGPFRAFDDVFMLDGERTSQVDYQGACADANPIDLGIKVARSGFEVLRRAGVQIAAGHPLATTGVRLAITVARRLKEIGARWGVALACIGGGQGTALRMEHGAAS